MVKSINDGTGNLDKSQFYVAGWFIDQKQNVLMVSDRDFKYEINGKINTKAPGGRSDEYAFYDQRYLETLKYVLEKAFFSKKEVKAIIERESVSRSPEERSLIVEMVEETGYYPFAFSESSFDFQFNRDSGKDDYKRSFFRITEMVERHPNPSAFKEPSDFFFVKEITPLPGFRSTDKDVIDPRRALPLKQVCKDVFVKHKVPLFNFIVKDPILYKLIEGYIINDQHGFMDIGMQIYKVHEELTK